ncbi:MAG: hypothetical protein COB36_12305 [Alphaproteobacteria bacterium]|nr:MAG: hypothetical protein COB36_12305 [Alphaproteobacteria bacterium]
MRFDKLPERLRENSSLPNLQDLGASITVSSLMNDAALKIEALERSDKLTHTEIYGAGQKLFGAAMRHAENLGKTVMDDGRDEHAWSIMSGRDLLLAAADYFDDTI